VLESSQQNNKEDIMPHTDAIPEDDAEFVAWMTNLLKVCSQRADDWGLPDEELAKLTGQAENFAALASANPDPSAEPNLLDGYTMYWDHAKRFRELVDDCLQGQGWQDTREVYQKILAGRADSSAFDLALWEEYLAGLARKTCERYGLPLERVDELRQRFPAHSKEAAPTDVYKYLTLIWEWKQ
jgi:hypothetical protein